MVKQLAHSIREFKTDSILTPIYVALEVLMETIIPLVMANLIDMGIAKGDMPAILKNGLILVLMALMALVFGALSGKYAARASAGFARNLRHDVYHHIQTFSFANLDNYSTAGIVTRLTTDVTNVQNAYQMLLRIAVRSPLLLLFSLGMVFSINAQLALIFLCVVPVLGLGLYAITRSVYGVFTRVFKTYDKLNNVVQENLLGIRVVKSFVREEHEKDKFGAVSQSIYKDFCKAEKTVALNMPLMQICVYTCMLLISWFGAKLVVSSTMTTGELTGMFTYVMQILMSLMMLSMVLVMVTMARSSADRIAEILEEQSSLANTQNPLTQIPDGSIAFNNVSFRYGGDDKNLCLKNVTLKINAGETVGIIGGTGAAKTTLVQLIPRLYDVSEGSVEVGGNDVRSYELDALRSGVAMVLQKNQLFSGTIKENLRWGCGDASDEQLTEACRLAQADGFIRELPGGYDTYVEQSGANLSGGQRQRICIARALLKKPAILILDDSTSAVDAKSDSLIRKAFSEEIPNTTKLIIAQRISSIEDADKIIVMDDGYINGFGTHAELLQSNEIYSQVYASQVQASNKSPERNDILNEK